MEKTRPTEEQAEFKAGSEKRLEDQKSAESTISIDPGDLHEPTYNNAGVKSFGIYSDSE